MRIHNILMLNCCLLFSIYSSKALPYSYLYFDKNKIKTSEASYRRYIRPQIKTIISEFYQSIRVLSPLLEKQLQIKRAAFKVRTIFHKETCLAEEGCKKKLINALSVLDKKVFQFIEIEGIKKKDLEFEANLELLHFLNCISNNVFKASLIISNAEPTKVKEKLRETIRAIIIYSDMQLPFTIPKKFFLMIDNVYSDYITNLEAILIANDQSILIDQMEQLNITWNTFHKKVAKDKERPPKNIVSTVYMMHNRWNSILKMYLKNTKFYDPKKM